MVSIMNFVPGMLLIGSNCVPNNNAISFYDISGRPIYGHGMLHVPNSKTLPSSRDGRPNNSNLIKSWQHLRTLAKTLASMMLSCITTKVASLESWEPTNRCA